MNSHLETLLTNPLPHKIGSTLIYVGEVSSLILDRIKEVGDKHTRMFYVDTVEALVASYSSIEDTGAVLINPSDELLHAAASRLTSTPNQATYILLDSAPSSDDYTKLKKRSQSNKMYFSVPIPKTSAAIQKWVDIFQRRWGVSSKVCAEALDMTNFSIGQLYFFDQQLRILTGGSMLSSSQASNLLPLLVNSTTSESVVRQTVSGHFVGEASSTSTIATLSKLQSYLEDVRVVQGAIRAGNLTPRSASTFSGLPTFRVMQAWEGAESMSKSSCAWNRHLVSLGLTHGQDNPDVLESVSLLWRNSK